MPKLYWETREGKKINIRDMGENHISNCIKYLQRRIDNGETKIETIEGCMSMDGEPYAEEIVIDQKARFLDWIERFKRELDRRRIDEKS